MLVEPVLEAMRFRSLDRQDFDSSRLQSLDWKQLAGPPLLSKAPVSIARKQSLMVRPEGNDQEGAAGGPAG
jgi:hypothetical protein